MSAAPARHGTAGTVRHLLRLARGAAALLTLSTLARTLSLVAGAALLVYPAWVIGRLADRAATPAGAPEPPEAPGALAVVLIMAGLAALKAVARYAEQLLGHVAAFTLLARLRTRLYDRLVPLAPAVTEAHGSGRLLSAATRDVDRVEVFYAHTLAPVVTAVVVPAGAVTAAALIAGPLPAAVLASAFLLGGALLVTTGTRSAGATARRLVEARSRLAQQVSDDVRGRSEIRMLGAEEQRAAQVDARGEEIGEALRASAGPLGARAAVQAGWQIAALLGVLATGIAAARDGGLSLAALLLALALVPGTAPALASIEALGASLPAALASARSLLELESAAPAVVDPDEPVPLGEPRGELRFADVTFAYPGRPALGGSGGTVLRGLDLAVAAGSVVAVVGATGCGKSTLARLLTRTWDADDGAVRLDGHDVSELALADLRAAVTVVDQRPVLLAGTVRENLLLASPDADDEALTAACALACLDLATLPGGLEARLGEDGARLSGGQAQRLALARGYLRGSPVLVLDEVTSHQDPLTQREMLRRLKGLRAGRGPDGAPVPLTPPRTVVLIAHRDAVLRHVDEVHVIEDGRVVESGGLEGLRAAGGAFSRLTGMS